MAGRPKTRLKKQKIEKAAKGCFFPGTVSFLSGSTLGFIIGRATAIPEIDQQIPTITQYTQKIEGIKTELAGITQRMTRGQVDTAEIKALIEYLTAELENIRRAFSTLAVLPVRPAVEQTTNYAKWVAPLITGYINTIDKTNRVNRNEEQAQRNAMIENVRRGAARGIWWPQFLHVIFFALEKTAMKSIFDTLLQSAYSSNNLQRQTKSYNILLLLGALDFNSFNNLYQEYSKNASQQQDFLSLTNIIGGSSLWGNDYDRLAKDPNYIDVIIQKFESLL